MQLFRGRNVCETVAGNRKFGHTIENTRKGTRYEIAIDQGYDPGGTGGDRAKGSVGQLRGGVRVLLRLRQQGRRPDRQHVSALYRRGKGDRRDQR